MPIPKAQKVNLSNANMRVVEACQLCKLDNTRDNLIRVAMSQLKLAGSKQIQVAHVAEALQYRPKSMAG